MRYEPLETPLLEAHWCPEKQKPYMSAADERNPKKQRRQYTDQVHVDKGEVYGTWPCGTRVLPITPEELTAIQEQKPINPPKPVLWPGTSPEAVELTTTYKQT